MENTSLLLETCAVVGQVMLENGAEMYRVEDTMNRIAGETGSVGVSFVTPTIVMIGLEETEHVKMKRVTDRTTNLSVVQLVNTYSREYTEGKINLGQLLKKVKEVNQHKMTLSTWLKILIAAVVSGSLMIVLGGAWSDFVVTCFIGGVGYSVYLLSQRFLRLKYFDEFIAAFCIGLLTLFFAKIGIGHTTDHMIIGSIMPYVPGLALTNSIRDLQQGHLLSGISRGVEVIIIAAMLAIGIAVAFRLAL